MTISETLSIYEEFLKSFVPLLKIKDDEGHRKALADKAYTNPKKSI